jgi:hypothetical protein
LCVYPGNFETSTRRRARHGVLPGCGLLRVARTPLRQQFSGSRRVRRRLISAASGNSRVKDRPECGAKTRLGGSCRVRVKRGRSRCRFHGGPVDRSEDRWRTVPHRRSSTAPLAGISGEVEAKCWPGAYRLVILVEAVRNVDFPKKTIWAHHSDFTFQTC